MKIGLYFGTFNPIHIGHLIIANHMAEHSDLEQIWMVVTPQNTLKQKNTLLDDYQRLHLVFLATEKNKNINDFCNYLKLPSSQELYYRAALGNVDVSEIKEFVKFKENPSKKPTKSDSHKIEELVTHARGKSDMLVIGDDKKKKK